MARTAPAARKRMCRQMEAPCGSSLSERGLLRCSRNDCIGVGCRDQDQLSVARVGARICCPAPLGRQRCGEAAGQRCRAPGALAGTMQAGEHALWEERERVATEAMGDVLTGLWETPAPASPFRSLVDAAGIWSEHLRAAYERAKAPFEMSLLDDALGIMATVKPADSSDVVLHQDLHGGNVLRRGEDWVAIDPKPLVGERAFDLASYVRDRRDRLRDDRDSEAVVRDRLEHLCSVLDVDRDRAKGWALAHALAWSFDAQANFYPDLVLAARLIARC
jgi:Aminoglycoside/hydroxyurea antibiotic resistance kinase